MIVQYKYYGLLAVAILFLGLGFVLQRWPQNRHKTFSQHVALKRSSILYYILLFAIVLPPLVLFFVKWFTPHFGVTHWLNICIIASAIFQFACTLVPETGGRMTAWHKSLVGISAALLIPALALLLIPAAFTIYSKALVIVAIAIMSYCIYITAVAKTAPRNFLIIQCVYFAAFFIPVLYISYLQ